MQHLDEGTIHAWLDGAFDADESSRIERHVADCATCSAAVAEARGLIAGASRIVSSLDVVRGGVIPAQPSAPVQLSLWRKLRLTPARAAIAASILTAAATLFSVRSVWNGSGEKASVAYETKLLAQPTPAPATAPGLAASGTKSVADTKVAAAPSAPPQTAAPKDRVGELRASATAPAETRERQAPAATLAPPPAAAAASAVNTVAGVVADTSAIAGYAARKKAEPDRTTVAASAVGGTSPARRMTDSMSGVRADRPSTAESPPIVMALRATAGGRAAGGGTGQVSDVAKTLAAPRDGVQGCYEMRLDSAAALRDVRTVPERFALTRTTGDAPQNIVRGVTAEGRVDQEIIGAKWEQLNPIAARVLWPAVGGGPRVLDLRYMAGSVAAQLNTRDGTRPVEVVRTVCRP